MKITYDEKVRGLYIYLGPENEIPWGVAKKTVPLDCGDFKSCIHLDLDRNDKLIGIEIFPDDPTPEGREILKKWAT